MRGITTGKAFGGHCMKSVDASLMWENGSVGSYPLGGVNRTSPILLNK